MAEAHTQKASDELLELMNRAIAREMQVSIQYMWQHIQWVGVKGFTVRDQLKLIAINGQHQVDNLRFLTGPGNLVTHFDPFGKISIADETQKSLQFQRYIVRVQSD